MQKLLNKMIAIIMTLMLASSSIMPAIVYATDENQDTKTSEENVEFNATINGGYNATLNLDEGGTLDLNLKVSNTGYLKEAKVTLEGNNYELDNSVIAGVRAINGNTIELDEVNTGEMLSVSIPIKLTREERVTSDVLGRNSKVTLNAIYVNENGKERKINKTLTEHVNWTNDLKEVVAQNLIRYIKFDESKTMLSFKISEGIENNKMPVQSKEISINVPTIDNNKPSNVIVTGKEISYNYENDVVTIKKENTPDSEGKIAWDSQDEYIVTYIYDTQVNEAKIESQVKAKVQVNGKDVEAKLDDYIYELKDEVGEYVEAETLGTDEINKGYIYTNLKNKDNNLETTFEVKIRASVGFKDTVDSIKIREESSMFNDSNAGDSVVNKKITINKDNFVNILGENGTLKVLSSDGKELGTLSKDVNEINIDQANIVMQTSKVEKEGVLEVSLEKAVNSKFAYSKNQLKEFTELTENAVVEGYKNDELNSSKQISRIVKLQEPTSNAEIDVNVQNLSTVVKNDDVTITTTLKTKDINDALYTNAKLNIVLPEDVKQINIKEASLLYDDALILNNLVANGNVISFQLDGTQTSYGSQATSDGTVVRIVAEIILDNLAPTANKQVVLNYSNEETGEANQVATDIGIVAPTGFVTTNTLAVDGESITAQESDEKISKIDVNSSAKEMGLSGTIVNNLGHEATGVTIIGKIPSTGNKDANDTDLGSNFDTQLTSAISVKGIDADILYSDNVNEEINGSSWSANYSSSTKSYKIVAKSPVEQVSSMSFNYNVSVPENLQYGSTSKATYAVYYDNDAEQGLDKNYVLAKAVGISTGSLPLLALEPKIVNTNTGAEIKDNGEVKEGTFITYKLNAKNTGNETASNVKINITLPDGIAAVNYLNDITDLPVYEYDYNTKTFEYTIDNLNVGETKSFDLKLAVAKILNGKDDNQVEQKISANLTADKLDSSVKSESTIKVVKGNIVGYATTNKEGKTLKPQDTVDYYFEIINPNYEKKQNVKATIKLPDKFKVQSVEGSENSNYTCDEKTNVLTYTMNSLDPCAMEGVLVSLTVDDFDHDENVKITGSISCGGMNSEETLNEVSYNLSKEPINTTLTSNIKEGNLGDKDSLDYYINVTNNSSETINAEVKDVIPAELSVLGYEIQDANGITQINTASGTIWVELKVNPSESARLTIRTKPLALQKGRVANIENKGTITYKGTTVDTNTLKHKIVGTSEYSAGLSTDPSGELGNGGLNGDVVTKEGTYIISGTTWLDENSNGIRELSEQKVSGLTTKLYNKNTENIATDIDGKELVATTNESGDYLFANVLPGSYTIVIDIDGQNYGVAPYKANNASESENSDFITTKNDEKNVAVTDEIIVGNANIYNIDLGLVKSKTFDIDVNKTVSRVSVANTKGETKIYDQDNLALAKVELSSTNLEFSTVLIEYTLTIENKGSVPGYAKSIIDYVPEGMSFNSELNSTWYLGQDGNAYNTSLANTLINPGESKTINIILSRKMSEDNTGTVRNTAEVTASYNEFGLADIDAGASSSSAGDKSSADVVIGVATGKEVASFTGIALGILAILAIAIYEIKKHVINKMYNFTERS